MTKLMANNGRFIVGAERVLDYVVEHWKRVSLALALAVVAFAGFFAYSYSAVLGRIGVFLGLFVLGIALKYPGRYASAGGTDIDTVLIVLISAGMGTVYGLLFALAFIPLGRKISLESPQEAALSLFLHTGLVLLTGFFAATPENVVWFVMAFVFLSVLMAGPALYYTGHPLQPLVIGIMIKVVWAYAFMNAFGVRIFEILKVV